MNEILVEVFSSPVAGSAGEPGDEVIDMRDCLGPASRRVRLGFPNHSVKVEGKRGTRFGLWYVTRERVSDGLELRRRKTIGS